MRCKHVVLKRNLNDKYLNDSYSRPVAVSLALYIIRDGRVSLEIGFRCFQIRLKTDVRFFL